MASSALPSEAERLRALASYELLDTPPESEFDQLTALAADVFQVPIAMVSLVDADRVWHKSMYGFGLVETPRAGAFCAGPAERPHSFLHFARSLVKYRLLTCVFLLGHLFRWLS